jgi:uncharacterized protein (TIGR02996 family)
MDDAALLVAIHSDPGDDTLRLAFADWLAEHDQSALAEFIRCQVRGLAVGENARSAVVAALPVQLRKGTRVEWIRRTVAFIRPGLDGDEYLAAELEFSRGFAVAVTCS